MDHRPIRIIIVDDHAVVRRGLSDFVSVFDDFDMVGEAEGGKQAVEMCARLQPDVVLMDMLMPEMDGATATQLIRDANPHIRIIALTSFREEALVNAAFKAGVIGYLLKNVTAQELAAAIRNAAEGRPTLAPEATLALMHSATTPRPPGADLTPREREVLSLMAQGFNNQQIADQLCIGLSTIKYHVSNIISKLGVNNRTEATALAIHNQLVNT